MSIIKHKEQRVGIFIDAQNLYHSAKNLYGKKVNFGNILKDVLAGRKLVRSIAYVISADGEEQSFFDALAKLGIEAKVKELKVFAGGAKKGDWDVGLTIDAVTMAPKLDALVLVAGDGDYVPLVDYLRIHSGIQVEVASFSQSSSQELIDACDDFMDLADEPKKYLIASRGKK